MIHLLLDMLNSVKKSCGSINCLSDVVMQYLKVAMFHDVFGLIARAVLLQDDAEDEEGGGVLLRGGLLPRPAPQRQGLQVPDLQGAGPVSTVVFG